MAKTATPINIRVLGDKLHISNEEIEERKKNEAELMAGTDQLEPPKWLSTNAKKIYNKALEELTSINLVNNLDVSMLALYADSLDKYIGNEKTIKKNKKRNKELEKLFKLALENEEAKTAEKTMKQILANEKLLVSLDKTQLSLIDTIRKLSVEYGLTPQARARLAIPRNKKKETKSEFETDFGDIV